MDKPGHTVELDQVDFDHSWVEVQYSPVLLSCYGGRHRAPRTIEPEPVSQVATIKPEPGSQVATNDPNQRDPWRIFACLVLAAAFCWLAVRVGAGDAVLFMIGIIGLAAVFEYLFERVSRITKK